MKTMPEYGWTGFEFVTSKSQKPISVTAELVVSATPICETRFRPR